MDANLFSFEYYFKLFIVKHQEHTDCNLLATMLMIVSICLFIYRPYFRGCKYEDFIFYLQHQKQFKMISFSSVIENKK